MPQSKSRQWPTTWEKLQSCPNSTLWTMSGTLWPSTTSSETQGSATTTSLTKMLGWLWPASRNRAIYSGSTKTRAPYLQRIWICPSSIGSWFWSHDQAGRHWVWPNSAFKLDVDQVTSRPRLTYSRDVWTVMLGPHAQKTGYRGSTASDQALQTWTVDTWVISRRHWQKVGLLSQSWQGGTKPLQRVDSRCLARSDLTRHAPSLKGQTL